MPAARHRPEKPAGASVLFRRGHSPTAIWFATVGWLRTVSSYDGARVLSYHRGTGTLYGAVIGASLVEVVVVHLLVSRWSLPVAAGLGS